MWVSAMAWWVKVLAVKLGNIEFDPLDPDRRRSELTPSSWSLISTCALRHMHAHEQVYVCANIKK